MRFFFSPNSLGKFGERFYQISATEDDPVLRNVGGSFPSQARAETL